MITAYHRPQSMEEALALIARSTPRTLPLGGGTLLSRRQLESIEVVDLQALGLGQIIKQHDVLQVGATSTLQQLLEDADCPTTLQTALKLEAPLNIRNSATVAGTLVVCDGRSPFTTVLLAANAKLTIMRPRAEMLKLGDFLPARGWLLQGGIISGIQIPLGMRVAFEYVSRTPADSPIVEVAIARWSSGRTRLAVGGFGSIPALAMDGNEPGGVEAAARNACHDSTDPWGSSEYRMDVAAVLARRCLARLT
jgi:putative selenate reductase FAD-binding subunit